MGLYRFRTRRPPVPVILLVVAVVLLPVGVWLLIRSATTQPPNAEVSPSVVGTPNAQSAMASGPKADGNQPGDAAPTRTGKVSRVVSWLSEFTPTGGGGYMPSEAYQELARDECRAVMETAMNFGGWLRRLYGGAGAACLATTATDPLPLWRRAESDLAAVSASVNEFDCTSRDVHRLLGTLVELHRQDPQAPIVRQAPVGASGSTCPRIVAVSPDHGPAAGGQTVVLTGENLAETVTIWFGDVVIGPVRTGKQMRVTITTPPKPESREQVEVKTADFVGFEGLVRYRYDAPGSQPARPVAPAQEGSRDGPW
jgi:hypothetical protein